MDSLQATDEAAKAVQKTDNRVSLADIEAKIAYEAAFILGHAVAASAELSPNIQGLLTTTLCVIQLENGFTVLGKSAPADPENFNAEYGRQQARADAVRQIWQLEGYLLRERLHAAERMAAKDAAEEADDEVG